MFHPGDLVGYLETREPQLAVIESSQGGKLRLRVGFHGKQQLTSKRHLELICPLASGETPPQRLGVFPWLITPESLNAAHPTRREWGAAWVLLSESDETLALSEFTELVCVGKNPTQLAVCWLALQRTQWMFRFKQGQVQARSSEELKRLRQDQRRLAMAETRRQQALNLLNQKEPISPLRLDPQLHQWFDQMKQLVTATCELKDLDQPCRSILKEAGLEHDIQALHRQLVVLGQLDPHQLPTLSKSRWSAGFNAELEADAAALVAASDQEQPGDEARLDLTRLHCVTIDDVETREIDDGLSLERSKEGRPRIWIHIADPGRLIKPGSALDQEAAARGSSLYLAQGNQPMFPEVLATGPFSLRAGRRNAAWSTWVELNDDGSIADFGIHRSWVKPLYKLSYDDADDLIDLAPPEEADLADLDQLLQQRKRWRENQGALLMDLPEGRIRTRDGVANVEITEPSASRLMVAEAMILAGAVAAQFGIDHHLPLPFRSQLPADLPSPAQLDELPEGAVRFAAMKRCLSRGLMGTQPAAHFSLGLPAYVQATSPIRRYGDLMVQRQIEACLVGTETLTEAQLQEQLSQVDLAVREGISISREDQRHWQQVWFEQHRDDRWQVDFLRWLRPQDCLGLVRIDALGLDLASECPVGCQPGDRLEMRVLQVDSCQDTLKLTAS